MFQSLQTRSKDLSELGYEDPRIRFIDILRKNFRFIKDNLSPNDKLVDCLYEDGYISRECREQLMALSRSDPARANDFVIKDLVRFLERLDEERCNVKVEELYRKFKEHDCWYLLEHVTQPAVDGQTGENLGLAIEALSKEDLVRLISNRSNKDLLREELEPKNIVDYLLEAGALTFNDHEDIRTTCSRLDRVTSLLGYIETDISTKGPPFLYAVWSSNAKLERLMKANMTTGAEIVTVAGSRDIRISLQNQAGSINMTTNIQVPTNGRFDLSLRLRLRGQAGELTSVEEEISTMEITRDLEMMAMDYDATIDGLSFSSVVIRLRAHSARAAALLSSKVMEPGGLVAWLDRLMTDEQKRAVAQAGLNTVTLELRIVSHADVSDDECQCLLSQDLVQGASLTIFRECVRDVDAILSQMYAMSCFSYLQRKEMLHLSNIHDNDEKIDKFRAFIFTFTDKELCVLESALRRTHHNELLERLTEAACKIEGRRPKRNHIEIKRCTSVLSTDTIEKALTLLTCRPIAELDIFLQRLITWCFDNNHLDDIEDRINEIKDMTNNTDKTTQTLVLLTQVPESCSCLFEQFLKETGQGDILCCLKEHNDLLALGEIGKREIEESITFLCSEIDPRPFYNIIPETALKVVTSHVRRQEKCRAFFRYILESDNSQDLVQRFVTQLLKLKLYPIINMLFSVKRSRNFEQARVNEDILKHKLLENKGLIADEVDVNLLQATFVDRKILTTEQASTIGNTGSRRERVVALLSEVLNQGYHAVECFISALKIAGYTYVAGCIENTADPVLSCPCISSSIDQPLTFLSETFLAEITTTDAEHSIDHPNTWNTDIETHSVGHKDSDTHTDGNIDIETSTVENKTVETPRVEDKDSEMSGVEDKDSETSRVEDKDSEKSRVDDKDNETSRVEDKDNETSRVEDKDSETYRVEDKDSEMSRVEDKDSQPSSVEDKDSITSRVEDKASERPRVEDKDSERSKVEDKDSERSRVEDKDSESYRAEDKDSETPRNYGIEDNKKPISGKRRRSFAKLEENGNETALLRKKDNDKTRSVYSKLGFSETIFTAGKAKLCQRTKSNSWSQPLTKPYKLSDPSQLLNRNRDRPKLDKISNRSVDIKLWTNPRRSKKTDIKKNTRPERERSAIVPFFESPSFCYSHYNTTVP